MVSRGLTNNVVVDGIEVIDEVVSVVSCLERHLVQRLLCSKNGSIYLFWFLRTIVTILVNSKLAYISLSFFRIILGITFVVILNSESTFWSKFFFLLARIF